MEEGSAEEAEVEKIGGDEGINVRVMSGGRAVAKQEILSIRWRSESRRDEEVEEEEEEEEEKKKR